MTDEEIQKARDNYNRIITVNNLLRNFTCGAKEELEELEKDPNVQRYKFLKDIVDFYNVSDNYLNDQHDYNLRNMVFTDIANSTKHSNKIYVFMGFFDRAENITIEKDKISYAVFSDLETLDTVTVPYKEYSYFIQNNKVVKGIDGYKKHNEEHYRYILFKTRKEFFNDLIENNQEQAIQKILKK